MRKSRKEYDITYKLKHPEQARDSHLKFYSSAPKRILRFTKYHAKRAGLEFNLDLTDIIIPTHCPYLGFEITTDYGLGRKDTNASIDRIDSTQGYVKGNVQIISALANRMKNSSTQDQLLTFAHNVITMHKARQTNDTDYDY